MELEQRTRLFTFPSPNNIHPTAKRSVFFNGRGGETKGVTHPENNSVEGEDEFEEYVGESVAVADLVVPGHGASLCGQWASAPARCC